MADHRDAGALLVHGTVNGARFGIDKTIPHAWIEQGGFALDLVLDWRVPVDAYARIFQAERHRRYTAEQACQQMLKTGRCGPGEESNMSRPDTSNEPPANT
jgi:hypothetical protein